MSLIDIVKVIVLGIVEGFTEWLPISSTGHMILVDNYIQLNVSQDFKDMFFVLIQLGAILAVVVLYFYKLNPFTLKKSQKQRNEVLILWSKVILASFPAAILGLLFDDWMTEHFYNSTVIAFTLIVYGILFILLEYYYKHKEFQMNSMGELTFKTAFFIGLFQVLSLIPGTSRSGATILGAMLIGCSRGVAAEFSFFLAIPVMFGASFLKLIKFGFDFTGVEIATLVLGMTVAFIVSIFSIKLLMEYIRKNDFKIFGYYRIVLGLLIIGIFLMVK